MIGSSGPSIKHLPGSSTYMPPPASHLSPSTSMTSLLPSSSSSSSASSSSREQLPVTPNSLHSPARPHVSPPSSSLSDSPHPLHHSGSVDTLRSKQSRCSLATFAPDITSSAITNLASIRTTSSPSLRSVASSSSLANPSWPIDADLPTRPIPMLGQRQISNLDQRSAPPSPRRHVRRSASSPVAQTVANIITAPVQVPRAMHQSSSRLLRMTEEDRPFSRDFKDLFSTLIVSLPLTPHRVRFTRVEHTFTSEEAINNLGSLKFSQSNRMPDPKDPSRIVTTTTTTTFSMAREMGRSVCQRFLDARFVEAAADPRSQAAFTMKGGVWQLTAKGIHVLHRFCNRNGIISQHIEPLLKVDNMQLVILERDIITDKLSQDRGTIEVIFRRLIGQDGPNIKPNVQLSDSDSLTDYETGMVGVKMAQERKIFNRTVPHSFTGKATCDWLMDCCTTIDRRETFRLGEMFIKLQLMYAVVEDKLYIQQNPAATAFQPTKNAVYTLTERGKRICGWITRDPSASSEDGEFKKEVRSKDSNNTRLNTILQDAALRLLFGEFLRNSLCEENLSFYLDVKEFTSNYRHLEKTTALARVDAVRETLAAAYGLYNAFLAPGSPCELNIDHGLRNSLASRMTRAVGDGDSMLKSLREIVELFELAQTSVFKLMSSDSVPKFVRDSKYANVLREHNLELGLSSRAYSPILAAPEKSISRPARAA